MTSNDEGSSMPEPHLNAPSLAASLPKLSEQVLKELANAILENSTHSTIMLLDGEIVDGRCRYAVFVRAGVIPDRK